MILVVPMNPEFLPELGLLIASVLAGGAALRLLFARQLGKAMRAGAASVACIALTFVMVKTFHKLPGPPTLKPAAENSMSLVLGDVVLRVAPSDRYVLSVGGEQFLELDLGRSGLVVSCVAGAHDRPATEISSNTFPFRWADIRPSRDSHTLLVQEDSEDIFRADYSEPRRIEIMGQFFEHGPGGPPLISLQKGIYWSGGRVSPGTVVDLRTQGKGTIDFGPSGSIRVRPDPPAGEAQASLLASGR
jgi:hypothetical protein